ISAVGYTGFTSSQVLAGAKLASGTFAELDINTALLIMGAVAVVYTVLGGIKAVIYTDTVQWIILMSGLIFIGLPISYNSVGGWEAIRETLAPEMLTFTNLSWQDLLNWAVTIIPIWFVAMTLYQRIYASRDEKTARRAWYIAGVFEWPIMALMGVSLGLLAKVGAEQGMFDYLGAENVSATDPETGLPMLLRTVLPVGLMGLMMSAYFSAVLSTADSCLMAASGNVVSDLLCRLFKLNEEGKNFMLISQGTTLLLGLLAVGLAWKMTSVLDLMLYSYAFLVSGLLVPILGALFWKMRNPTAAFVSMIVGGSTTVGLTLLIPEDQMPLGLDGNVFGILAALLIFMIISYVMPGKKEPTKSLKYT
ncbi:MAG: sodium:solute symporter, partial [Cyclobacteriaceae bacterium]